MLIDIWAVQKIEADEEIPPEWIKYMVQRPSFFQTLQVDLKENVQDLRERLRLMIPERYEKVDLLIHRVQARRKPGINILMRCEDATPCSILKSDNPLTIEETINNTLVEYTSPDKAFYDYFDLVPLERVVIHVVRSS
jgi:hypothetical protein